MNLSNVDELKTFLKQSGLRPNDYLGQNFLVDEQALRAIVDAADLKSTDTVLEVGPGLGVLTGELVKRAGRVIAVEKDDRLYEILKERYSFDGGAARIGKRLTVEEPLAANRKTIRAALPNNVQLINQDILKFNIGEYIQDDYKVVANIPYYLTSKLFQIFLESAHPPKLLVLMIQKEVGERVVARPGELSILGISVQIFADAEIMQQVPKTSFWPSPKVDSVILKIAPREKYPEITDQKLFFRIVKMAFAGKRKQIHNTIRNPEALEKAGIDPTARPQDLSIEEWIKLYKVIERIAGSVERGDVQ